MNRVIPDIYCRSCLQELDYDQIDTETMKSHHISPEIGDKLRCIGINFEPEDQFPKILCDCCYNQIKNFDKFRIMCIASMQRFLEMLSEVVDIKDEEAANGQNEKNDLLESEMLEVSTPAQELNSVQNPLEINNKRLLRKQKESHSKSKNVKKIKCKKNLKTHVTEIRNVKGHSRKNIIDEEIESKSSKIFQCELCSMRFFVEHRFNAHKRTHDGLIPYPCPREDCDRGFERWHSLSEHLKQHEGTNRLFSCEEQNCNRRYKHKATLDLHLRRYHKKGPELKSFVCEICGKVFKSSAILNDHRFIHVDKSELPFACTQPQCKYRFSNKAKLKVHLMRHEGIKKYICPHCNIRKTTKNELKIHINYHTLERRFPCRFCSQVCNNSGNLKVHIRTVHERAKDYACRFCERTFAKPDTRKYHEMIHTGEKPHECSVCGKRFVQPAALRTHKKIHLRHVQCEIQSASTDTIHEEKL